MKDSTLRITALILAAALLLPLTACGGGTVKEPTATAAPSGAADTSAAPAETKPATDEYGRELIDTALPELDFKGAKLNLFVRNDQGFEYEFDVTEANGEVMNDVIYERNKSVEERLKIAMTFTGVSLSGGNETKTLENSITAGDGAFDLAAVHSSYGARLARSGYFYNLNRVKYCDFDKPWWNSDLNEELNVYNYLPFAYGSACLSGTMRAVVTFFNSTKAATSFKGVNLYQVVKDGKWTMDKLYELCDAAYVDTNGDGKRDNGDFYGLAMMQQATPMDAFIAAFDLSITTRNKDGIPELSLYSERTVNAIDALKKLLNENKGVITLPYNPSSATAANELCLGKFKDSTAIFTFTNLYFTDELRDFADDYGILPMPKYDEAQAGYYTLPHNAFSLLAIPIDTKNADAADAAMEALCEQSWRTVMPAYFETAMKSKYLRDQESAQMFDLIMDGVHINFGSAYQKHCIGAIGELIRNLSLDFASTYASKEASFQSALADLLENLKKNGEGK